MPPPFLTLANLPGLVRQARQSADLSQRELAARIGVSPATVGRIESGDLTPSVGRLLQLLAAAKITLVAVDHSGRVIPPERVGFAPPDSADRTIPGHLDLARAPLPGGGTSIRPAEETRLIGAGAH